MHMKIVARSNEQFCDFLDWKNIFHKGDNWDAWLLRGPFW